MTMRPDMMNTETQEKPYYFMVNILSGPLFIVELLKVVLVRANLTVLFQTKEHEKRGRHLHPQ